MKRTASEKKTTRSKDSSTKRNGLAWRPTGSGFVVCIKSGGYVDLEPLKVYRARRDARAEAEGLLRIVDATGEDYLYPHSFFRRIEAPPRLFKLVEAAALEPKA